MQASTLQTLTGIVFCVLMMSASGCKPTPLDEDPPARVAKAAVVALPSTDAKNDTKVVEKSWAELQQEIGELKGRVVVVNIWTNTCAVCLAEYPAFAELTRRWPEDKVVFYDVNCDYDGIDDKPPAFYRSAVLEFLNQHPADSRHIALTDPFIDFLDENDIRSTPTMLVYDRSAKLVKRFDNDEAYKEEDEFHAEDVGALVEQLIEGKS